MERKRHLHESRMQRSVDVFPWLISFRKNMKLNECGSHLFESPQAGIPILITE